MPANNEEPVVHVLWMNAGLSCDGDSVSVTAATLPSIEDIALGALPGLAEGAVPLAAAGLRGGRRTSWNGSGEADAGRLDPFVLVVEGSIPNEKIKSEGYWTGFGTDPHTGQPITLTSGSTGWRRRPGPSSAPAPAPPTAAFTPWRAIRPAPWAWPITWAGTGARRPAFPIVNVPGCPVQPDNMMETLLYLLYQAAGLAPMIPLDDQLRPTWLFGKTVHEGCDRAGYYEQGDFAHGVRLAQVPGEDRLLGAGGQLQRDQARLDGRHRRLPERGRHLHRLHHAGLPGQVHAVHGRAAGQQGSRPKSPATSTGR